MATELHSILTGDADFPANSLEMRRLLRRISPEDIPATADLLCGALLEQHLESLQEPTLSLLIAGDIMLGGRARKVLAEHGSDYPFQAVLPLLKRAHIVVGNLEGPLAVTARKQLRNFSYRVAPHLASSLTRAGISVVTLANNHLVDCGRDGVIETLEALEAEGVAALGAGRNEKEAHAPVIRQVGSFRIGLLAYYWNRRCAATAEKPGSAMDPPASLALDIHRLRSQVDRIVVTFHWGVPYERDPAPEDRAKARLAVECGADAVIGHHPHIVQPFEIYRGCPIFYSVGNFTFGSANSRSEGILVGLRFEDTKTLLFVYPMYVKNRDPRVHYQPKLLQGQAAERVLSDLARISSPDGEYLKLEQGRGRIELNWPGNSLKNSTSLND